MPETTQTTATSTTAPPPAAEQTQPQTQTPPPAGVSKEEFEALKAQTEELKRTSQYWYEQANKRGASEDPAKPKEEPDEDLLDVITTKGIKGFDEFMRKRGYVSREEVEATVNSKAAQLSKEQELFGRYPDLKQQNSEFFKATASYYGDLRKQGVPEAIAMELAAEKAELEGIRTGKLKTPKEREAEEKAALAAERAARARAQAPDRSGRAPEGDPEDDELTPEQRAVAIKMLAGDGVTEEQAIEKYKARAKQGIRMSVKGSR